MDKQSLWDRFLQWKMSPLAYWLYHALDNPAYWAIRSGNLHLAARSPLSDPLYWSTGGLYVRGMPDGAINIGDTLFLIRRRRRLMQRLALNEVLTKLPN